MWKWIRRGLAALLALVLVAAGGGYLWLQSSLPRQQGSLTLRGISAPVEILRDKNGVPNIFAANDTDAYFALGFVHAQDRLWQMDIQRRMGTGRLAEVLGEPGLALDRLVRTLGLYHLAERSFQLLEPEVQVALNAYADGVNAYLGNHAGAWAPEFRLLDYEPEPWLPADTLVWGRLMALQLSSNWRDELLRARLLGQLDPAQLEALWPAYPAAAPVSLSRGPAATQLARIWAALPTDMLGTGASNAWAVAGTRTASGKPILANDPHLGLGAPILWYLARIETPTLSVTGATVPGVPFHLLGHNGRIAWGLTTTDADTDDLFVERQDPEDPSRYLSPGGPQPFARREELIKVRDGPSVTMYLRRGLHGPIVDSVLGDGAEAARRPDELLALAAPWLEVDDRTPAALYHLNRARDWAGFTAALRRFDSPVQNVLYADTGGTIGLYTAGRIPVRAKGDGYLPAPGWTGAYDWTGFIPFEALPHRRDPADGRLINANNAVVGPGYPYFVSREWGAGYRARRIGDLLDRPGPQSMETTAAIQTDTLSYAARELLPRLLAAPAVGTRAAAVRRLLAAWDGRMDRGRAEPLVFTAWLRALGRRLYADELAGLFGDYWGLRPRVMANMLSRATAWCDDVGTRQPESCDDTIAAALADALDELTAAYGPDMAAWRWGQAHYADLSHRVFRHVPGLRDLVDIRLPADGGDFTVNRAGTAPRDTKAPYADRHGPGYRAIYDLASPANSLFMIATGQSGNPLSAHFGDLAKRWRNGAYIRIRGSRKELLTAGARRLILRPQQASD